MQSTSALLYCHLRPVWLYHSFPHYLIMARFSEEKLLNIKCVSWFSLEHLSKTFLTLRITQQDVMKLCRKYPLLLSGFNETWIFSIDFQKTHNYQISWKSLQWQLSCSMWMDWHDEASICFLQFCAQKQLLQKRHIHQQGMQSAAGMSKEEKLFIIARSITLLCVCQGAYWDLPYKEKL